MFAAEYKRVSAHTNFEMAALSLSGAVRQMEDILVTVRGTGPANDPAEIPNE
jgi:hypothetical protein